MLSTDTNVQKISYFFFLLIGFWAAFGLGGGWAVFRCRIIDGIPIKVAGLEVIFSLL